MSDSPAMALINSAIYEMNRVKHFLMKDKYGIPHELWEEADEIISKLGDCQRGITATFGGREVEVVEVAA